MKLPRNQKDNLAKQILREIWDCGLQDRFIGWAKDVKKHRYMSAKEMKAFLRAIQLVKSIIPPHVLADSSPQKRFSEWYREVN